MKRWTRKRIPSNVSSWTFKDYCNGLDIELKTLDDVVRNLDRMIRDYGFNKANKNRLIPVAVKGVFGYTFSSEFATTSLDGILMRDPNGPSLCYDEASQGKADSIQLWMKHGTRMDMVTTILAGTQDPSKYIVLDKHSIFFDLPPEQISYLAKFLEDHRRMDSLLGIEHWESHRIIAFPNTVFEAD